MTDLVGPAANRFDGFVHAEGRVVRDGLGKAVLLRGVGLGNWLLPEGYMWKFGDEASSPRAIEEVIRGLLGETAAREFWSEYHDRFIGEGDIQLIADTGFDHVRLPINSRIVMTYDGDLIEEGFRLIDRLIGWCRTYGLWVLLDLHGAPGGQTGTNIDDSPNGKPELFMDRRYRDQTIHLWEQIAERYRDETVVLGYDLINEPLPNEWQHIYKDELAELYRDLTQAIRQIDTNHLLVYEGSNWATNWEIFTEVWDANSMLQFHRYWCAPDRSSIQEYLDVRDRLNLPIYMGEGGENNPEWIYTATRLYEQHDVGWNFWPWKKVDTVTSPVSIVPPAGWPQVVAFAGGDRSVDVKNAADILRWYLDNLLVENCEWRQPVVNALFARAPLTIPAWGFSLAETEASARTTPAIKTPLIRATDQVAIDFADPKSGLESPNWHHSDGRGYAPEEVLAVQLQPGDSLRYMVAAQAGKPSVTILDTEGNAAPVLWTQSGDTLEVTAHGPTHIEVVRVES